MLSLRSGGEEDGGLGRKQRNEAAAEGSGHVRLLTEHRRTPCQGSGRQWAGHGTCTHCFKAAPFPEIEVLS